MAVCSGGASTALAATPQIALGVNSDRASNPAQVSAYTEAAGRSPAIVMWYQSWSEPLYWSSQMPPVDAAGAEPLITWSPAVESGGVPLADIADGQWDGYIRDQAQLAKSYGKPMMIRFAHEMNLPGDAYGPGVNGNTPERFVAAWRHIVSVFREAGADNVKWVWTPNVYCGGACPFTDFYPGDAWTDWVGLDGYNYGAVSDMPWMSLSEVFKPSYDILTQLTDKPVMIAETSSIEQGGDKGAWIRQGLLHDVPELMPRVKAVVWFDRVKETDWRVDSSPQTLAAWRDVVGSPLYQAAPPSDWTSDPGPASNPGPADPGAGAGIGDASPPAPPTAVDQPVHLADPGAGAQTPPATSAATSLTPATTSVAPRPGATRHLTAQQRRARAQRAKRARARTRARARKRARARAAQRHGR